MGFTPIHSRLFFLFFKKYYEKLGLPMVTERLDMAVRNFQQMNHIVERYTRLSRAYVELAERFHQLDVDHMRLKGQVVPLLQTVKAQQTHIQQLQSDYQTLHHTLEEQAASHHQEQQTIQAQQARIQELEGNYQSLENSLEEQAASHRQELQRLTKAYEDRIHSLSLHLEELQPLENLLSAAAYEELSLAEEQMELVETTLEEMAEDSAPDLSEEEKALLSAYRTNPGQFLAGPSNGHSPWVVVNNVEENLMPSLGH
jgi:chromosome segregation ATPase